MFLLDLTGICCLLLESAGFVEGGAGLDVAVVPGTVAFGTSDNSSVISYKKKKSIKTHEGIDRTHS